MPLDGMFDQPEPVPTLIMWVDIALGLTGALLVILCLLSPIVCLLVCVAALVLMVAVLLYEGAKLFAWIRTRT